MSGGRPITRPTDRPMKRSDISDEFVIFLARQWRDSRGCTRGVIEDLESAGVPTKLAYSKVEHLIDRGLLECGVSPRYAWPTPLADEMEGQ